MRRIPRAELTTPPIPIGQAQGAPGLEQVLSAQGRHAGALLRAQKDMVEITRQAVTALVCEELALNPGHIIAVVHELAQKVRMARQLTVRIHPDDRALLPSAAQLAEQIESHGVIEVVADPELSRGDCMIESDHGALDGRIETKLAQLVALLAAQGPA